VWVVVAICAPAPEILVETEILDVELLLGEAFAVDQVDTLRPAKEY
jgi:hypothetical protein